MASDRSSAFSRRRLLGGASSLGVAGATGCIVPSPGPEGGIWEPPPNQRGKGNRWNLILLVADTFRADNLKAYGGNGLVHCPRLDRFAEDSVVFEDCYAEALPTIPVRRTLLTGRRATPFHFFHAHNTPTVKPGWQRLFHEDQTLAETLHEAGYQTALIADNPHYLAPGMNFHRGYRYFEWTCREPWFPERFEPEALRRAALEQYPQEVWKAFDDFDPVHAVRRRRELATVAKHLAEDGPDMERTARQAIRWLRERDGDAPFFLHLETFDPHEPWTPSRRFLDQGLPQATGPKWWQPPPPGLDIPATGADRLRVNYAAEALEVDYWLGEVLATVGELGLLDRTVVAFFADHGALLGEQGDWCKGSRLLRRQVTHTPLVVRLPGRERAGTRAAGLLHHPDVLPTLLQLLELEPPPRATGRSLWNLVHGEASPHEGLVQCYNATASIRTHDWQFSKSVDRLEHYLASFEDLGYVTRMAGLGTPYAAQLYRRADDPDELTDIASQNPAAVAELGSMIDRYLESGEEVARGYFQASAI